MAKVALYLVGLAWFALVVFWPVPSDIKPNPAESKRQQTGEGLYKSPLTTANFGLLGVRFYETSEQKKHWFIHSRFAELHRKENYAFMQDVNTEFYAEKTGNVVFTKSDYGRSLIEKHLVELEGNVSIRSKRGYLFSMDKLNYNGNNHEFDSDDPVRMKGPIVDRPTMVLRGVGLHADIDTEHFILRRNVAAQRRMRTNEWLRINSKSAEFFTEEQRAVFIGKVRSTLPQLNIDSDIFEISTSRERESMLARGNVVLRNKDRIGRAEVASVEMGSNQIILEGKARIDAQGNEIQGRRIVLYTDSDRVEVDEAEGKVVR